ncbi:hypothetical protein CARUB_v10025144mg, partial [Capsella rubella]
MASPPPSNDKPFGISQIKAYIPITLDMSKLNYDKWRELFETHCLSFGVLDHIDGSSSSTPATEKVWKKRDGLVKMWIYGTISESILDTILKKNATARDLWLSIESLFHDNKEARALQLEHDLRTMVIGDRSVHDYCQNLKSTADLLANIDSPVSERVLVMHLLNGLSDKFDSIINMEEERLAKIVKPSSNHHDTPSSSTILYTTSDGTLRNNNNNNNFGRGNRGRNRGGGRFRGRGRYNNAYSSNTFTSPWYYNYPPQVYASTPAPSYPQQSYPHFLFNPSPPYHAPPHHTNHSGILGSHPSRPQAHLAYSSDPTSLTPLPASLTHAFNTMTLQEP